MKISFCGRTVTWDRLKQLNIKLLIYIPMFIYLETENFVMDLIYCGASLGKSIQPTAKGFSLTQSSSYGMLKYSFGKQSVCIDKSDVIVDVGCGEGRVLNYLANKKRLSNKLVGIEFNKAVAEKTRKMLRAHENITIITGDIRNNIPQDATVFYLFNPFNREIMREFKNCLLNTLPKEQKTTLLYTNAVHLDVFANDPNWDVKEYDVGFPIHWRPVKMAIIHKRVS